MAQGFETLTEREKETLRLILRGHDAKSMACELDLSVHTINERLRTARRKLEVTSSREAARLLLENEDHTPQFLGDKDLGDGTRRESPDQSNPSNDRHRVARRTGWPAAWLAGGLIMSALFALLLVLSPFVDGEGSHSQDAAAETISTNDAAVEKAARDWLALVDARDWQASFEAAGKSFRDPNTVAGWAEASEQVRTPLGTVISRELLTVRYLNAPPHGYQEVTFDTQFANKGDVKETITLQKEEGVWKVVGILVD